MSVNLELAVEFEGGGAANLFLSRFSAGITHSASVVKGETVIFPNGVSAEIAEILHHWQPTGSDVAPVSVAFAEATEPITQEQWDKFLALGFVAPD